MSQSPGDARTGPAPTGHGGPGVEKKIRKIASKIRHHLQKHKFLNENEFNHFVLNLFLRKYIFCDIFSRTGCEWGQPGGTGLHSALVSNIYRNKELDTPARIWTDQNILTSQGLLLQFWSLSESNVNVWCSLQCDYQSFDTKVALTLEPTPAPLIPAIFRPPQYYCAGT